MLFFSKITGGFYDTAIHGEDIPSDAVEITQDDRVALLDAQAKGKAIMGDDNGFPIAVDPPAPSLNDLKDRLVRQIDDAADAARLTVAGDALRAEEYRIAENEARAYQDAGYTGAVPASVQSWAEAKGWTGQQAAEDILAVAAAWTSALYVIRDARLKAKESVRSASTAAVAQAIAAEACASINALTTKLANGQS